MEAAEAAIKLYRELDRVTEFASLKARDGQEIGYCLGWRIGMRDGMKEVSHGGGQQRVSTLLYMLWPRGERSAARGYGPMKMKAASLDCLWWGARLTSTSILSS